jgi:HAMP domain-containing protein|tara:strand:+ start:148 stop:390 length:243 start_codon:yes stop_codon:yes gene_type:complete
MDLVETLKKYAVLVGIVSTLGGGFYAWGVFNNRLDELEQSTNAKAVKELNRKTNILEKELRVLETRFEELKVSIQNPLKN